MVTAARAPGDGFSTASELGRGDVVLWGVAAASVEAGVGLAREGAEVGHTHVIHTHAYKTRGSRPRAGVRLGVHQSDFLGGARVLLLVRQLADVERDGDGPVELDRLG